MVCSHVTLPKRKRISIAAGKVRPPSMVRKFVKLILRLHFLLLWSGHSQLYELTVCDAFGAAQKHVTKQTHHRSLLTGSMCPTFAGAAVRAGGEIPGLRIRIRQKTFLSRSSLWPLSCILASLEYWRVVYGQSSSALVPYKCYI